jgi:hypothetical protein
LHTVDLIHKKKELRGWDNSRHRRRADTVCI